MQSCWQIDPARRPSISEIQSTIRDMLPPRDRVVLPLVVAYDDELVRRDAWEGRESRSGTGVGGFE